MKNSQLWLFRWWWKFENVWSNPSQVIFLPTTSSFPRRIIWMFFDSDPIEKSWQGASKGLAVTALASWTYCPTLECEDVNPELVSQLVMLVDFFSIKEDQNPKLIFNSSTWFIFWVLINNKDCLSSAFFYLICNSLWWYCSLESKSISLFISIKFTQNLNLCVNLRLLILWKQNFI